MHYDGWYKTLRKSNICVNSTNDDNTSYEEQKEIRSLKQNLQINPKTINDICNAMDIYGTEDLKLKLSKRKVYGMEAEGEEAEPNEEVADEPMDDAFADLGGDDTNFDDFTDDSSDFMSDDTEDKKEEEPIDRKEKLSDSFDQNKQIRQILKFPKKFEALREIISTNAEIARNQSHMNEKAEVTLRDIAKRYDRLLESLDIYINDIENKLHEDIFSDYIQYHTAAKGLKMSYDAVMSF